MSLNISKVSNGYLLETDTTTYFPSFGSLISELSNMLGESITVKDTRSESVELAATTANIASTPCSCAVKKTGVPNLLLLFPKKTCPTHGSYHGVHC